MVKVENLASSSVTLNFKKGLRPINLRAGSSVTLSPLEFSLLELPEESIRQFISITKYNVVTKDSGCIELENPTHHVLNVRFEKNGKRYGKNINPKSSLIVDRADYEKIVEIDPNIIINDSIQDHKIDFWHNVSAFESKPSSEDSIPSSVELPKVKDTGFQLEPIDVKIPKSDTKVSIPQVKDKKVKNAHKHSKNVKLR